MPQEDNLETLMARYQQGDFAAVTALVDRITPLLHRFFLAQHESRPEADDLLQETWLQIHKVRHTYRAGEPVLPWFYAIARHIRVDHFRRSMRVTAGARKLEVMTKTEPTSRSAPDHGGNLEALLAPLSRAEREVIEMLKMAGMSIEEVARVTSSSVGSVKQKAHRAYQKLRQRLAGMGHGKGRSGGQS